MVRAWTGATSSSATHTGPGSGWPGEGEPAVAPWDDEEDWVGTPPEGRYSRDRARPEYWRRLWPLAGIGLAVALVILIVAIVAH